MSGLQVCCMVMKINLDCNACCRKMRRIILRMKEIETHVIEKQHLRVIVCGRFIPAEVAIKIRKKMKRRVEILEIQELNSNTPNEQQHVEQGQYAAQQDHGAPEHHQGGQAMAQPEHGMPMPQYSHFPEHHQGMAQPEHAMAMPQHHPYFPEQFHPMPQPA